MQVKEFGNIKPKVVAEDGLIEIQHYPVNSYFQTDKEILFDVTATDKEVKLLLQMSWISKDIKINTYNKKVEIKTKNNSLRI